jgi:uncharacterized membrane protein
VNLTLLYPWIKALHVAADFIFAAGLAATTLFLAVARGDEPGMKSVAQGLQRLDRNITMPAMLFAWILGILLATTGHWLGQAWLNSKIILVIFMSGLHGVQSARLRRLSEGSSIRLESTRIPMLLVFICGIAILAVIKPH